MEENVIQINGGIVRNVDVSVKNIYVEKIIFQTLLHVVVETEIIWQVLSMIQWLRVMKLLKKKKKQLRQVLMKQLQSVKQKISIFYLLFN